MLIYCYCCTLLLLLLLLSLYFYLLKKTCTVIAYHFSVTLELLNITRHCSLWWENGCGKLLTSAALVGKTLVIDCMMQGQKARETIHHCCRHIVPHFLRVCVAMHRLVNSISKRIVECLLFIVYILIRRIKATQRNARCGKTDLPNNP